MHPLKLNPIQNIRQVLKLAQHTYGNNSRPDPTPQRFPSIQPSPPASAPAHHRHPSGDQRAPNTSAIGPAHPQKAVLHLEYVPTRCTTAACSLVEERHRSLNAVWGAVPAR